MFVSERALHGLYVSPSGKYYMVDVANTWDCGWEGAYAEFDEEIFNEAWYKDGDTPPTTDDIAEWGEEYGAFPDWEIVSTHHRDPDVAIHNLLRAMKKLP